jgi:hypothetical protein
MYRVFRLERSFSTDEAISYLLSATQVIDDAPNLTFDTQRQSSVYLTATVNSTLRRFRSSALVLCSGRNADELPSRCGRGRSCGVLGFKEPESQNGQLTRWVDGKNLFLQLEGVEN